MMAVRMAGAAVPCVQREECQEWGSVRRVGESIDSFGLDIQYAESLHVENGLEQRPLGTIQSA